MAKATVLGSNFPHTDQTGMSILVISVPKASRLVPESVGDQFDASGGIGDEDKIKGVGIRVEEAQCP